MVDTLLFGLLLVWVVRGQGDAGLFGWKTPPSPAPPPLLAPGRPRR